MNPDEYLNKARRSYSSALILLDDGDTNGACNRAFYAVHFAAHAAISGLCSDISGEKIKTHSGLITIFSKEFIVIRN